jgi:sugar/nucleoside kinase (ribokinase family)
VDVVGVGLNATDTLIRLPHFPALDSKVEIQSVEVCLGGQVASAMVACSRWGLRTRYVGKVGEDEAAELQRRAFESDGVEAHLAVARECRSQFAYILVDEASGERTILWNRDTRLELQPEELHREWVQRSKALLVDGHDTAAASAAARWAREAQIPVTADLDNLYPGVEVLLENVDYLIASREFPERLLGEKDLTKSLPQLSQKFRLKIAGATLGRDGVLAWDGTRFFYSPAFRVEAADTTGAGDIFHGAFVYALLQGWPLDRMLDFSCAAAALNCTAVGARGGIRPLAEVFRLMEHGERYPAVYTPEALNCAAES